jgi:serine/threonine protein kinase
MSDLSVGSTFAGCRLEAVAGRGGMGVVFRATQVALDRLVALKAIAPGLTEDAEFRERFQRESQIAASIDHPNVIPVYEAGELDGTLYLIMRWVDGTDLTALLTSSGRLAPARAVRLLTPVASALGAAHRRGLVHRDVKPGNVLISRGGESGDDEHVYLTDFGIARRSDGQGGMTRTGVLVGTLDYTAPERIEGGRGDASSDIYAFGCMLFEMVTGHVPFDREGDVPKMWAHLNEPVPSARSEFPEVPPGLDAIIAKAMAKKPADRFESAAQLASALGQALDEMQAGPTIFGQRLVSSDRLDAGTPAAPETEPAAEATAPSAEAPATPTAQTEPAAPATRSRVPTLPDDRPPPPAPPRRGRPRAILIAAPIAALAAVAAIVVLATSGGSTATHTTVPPGPAPAAPSNGPEAFQATGALTPGTAIDLGSAPGGLAFAGGNVWASLPARSEIARIDPATMRTQTFPLGVAPGPIASGAGKLWVADRSAPRATLVDPGTGGQRGSAALPSLPDGIAVDQDDGSAWVTSLSGVVHVSPSGTVGPPVAISPAPNGIAVGEGAWAWLATGAGKGLVRVGANGAVSQFDSGPQAVGVALDQGVWTAHATGEVTRSDPRTANLDVGARVSVGSPLDGIAAVERGDSVYVYSTGARKLYRIAYPSGPVVGSVTFRGRPTAVAVLSNAVWVATDDGKVTPIAAPKR